MNMHSAVRGGHRRARMVHAIYQPEYRGSGADSIPGEAVLSSVPPTKRDTKLACGARLHVACGCVFASGVLS